MAKLHLEFIPRTHVPWIGLAFLLIVMVASVYQAVAWMDLNAAQQRSEERCAKLELALKERQHAVIRQQESMHSTSGQRRKDERKIVDALRYPWSRVLSTIEQASGNDVALLALAHDQSGGSTQLSVEAPDVAALSRFIEKMNDGNEATAAGHWYLASYQTQLQNSPASVKGSILNNQPAK